MHTKPIHTDIKTFSCLIACTLCSIRLPTVLSPGQLGQHAERPGLGRPGPGVPVLGVLDQTLLAVTQGQAMGHHLGLDLSSPARPKQRIMSKYSCTQAVLPDWARPISVARLVGKSDPIWQHRLKTLDH